MSSHTRCSSRLILTSFAAEGFAMVVLSSVTASVIGRSAFGNVPFLILPPFHTARPNQLVLFAALGVVAGAVGVAFSKVLYWIEDACDWAWRWPEWARPAVGGLLLGGLLLALPEMYGVDDRHTGGTSRLPCVYRASRAQDMRRY